MSFQKQHFGSVAKNVSHYRRHTRKLDLQKWPIPSIDNWLTDCRLLILMPNLQINWLNDSDFISLISMCVTYLSIVDSQLAMSILILFQFDHRKGWSHRSIQRTCRSALNNTRRMSSFRLWLWWSYLGLKKVPRTRFNLRNILPLQGRKKISCTPSKSCRSWNATFDQSLSIDTDNRHTDCIRQLAVNWLDDQWLYHIRRICVGITYVSAASCYLATIVFLFHFEERDWWIH